MTAPTKYMTLKHLLIGEIKQIGLQFNADNLIERMVKTLPGITWSNAYNMYYIPNQKENLNLIFETFKGIAWVNGAHFFPKIKSKLNNTPVTVNDFRKRKPILNYRVCPENYLLKLELKQYAINTAKIYIHLFEKFINHYKDSNLNNIDENDIRLYMQQLVQKGKSHSYINQMINTNAKSFL
jgi:integrase/recombinase XerD